MLRSCVFAVLAMGVASQGAYSQRRQPGRAPGFGAATVFLVSTPAVRKELKLVKSQAELLDALAEDLGNQIRRARMSGPAAGRSVRRVNRRYEDFVSDVLDEKQFKRLNELRIQREGLAAFDRPRFRRSLGLNSDQARKILSLRERSDGKGVEARIREQLTEEQRKKWAEMKGAKFHFPETSPSTRRRPSQSSERPPDPRK